jgi:DNA invertase Pin-like site-specific DNA recombinase
MIEIFVNGPDGLQEIIERLDVMPMTRNHGKGIIARIAIPKPAKAVALYLRVSGAKQAAKGKGSLPEQFQSSWDEAVRRGEQIVAIYTDVCTAANRNRWAFKILLEDLSAGKIDMIACWHSSRLLRTQLAAGELEEAMEKLSRPIEMFAIKDVLDVDLLGILAWAGRWERKAFRERSLMGRQAAAADNRPPFGKPPFWLEVIRDENNKPAGFVLKPVAEWIKWAAQSYADGIGSTQIVDRLNLEGVPRATGRTKYGWTRQYLAQILKYSALRGKWGPFWGTYVDVPALIDEETYQRIQVRMKENDDHQGRPADHFVALRGLLWCGECGQKMGSHVRDWDYTYKKLADGTKARYRIQKQELRIKFVCGGQQHYKFKCRTPEYVQNKVLFPRVWAKLCDALMHREVLLNGLETQLKALAEASELSELKHIEGRLTRLHQRELSYAEQRADGSIDKAVHQELTMRIEEDRKELVQAHAQLIERAKLIEQARDQLSTAQSLILALPEALPDLPKEEQEQLVMSLITRIDVDKDNQVKIHLVLDPRRSNDPHQPKGRSVSSRQPESEQTDDSPSVGSDNSKVVSARHREKENAERYTRSKDCTRG